MNTIAREKIVAAFDEAMRVAGATGYEDAMRTVLVLLNELRDKLRTMETLDQCRAFLDSLPPMSTQEERLAVYAAQRLPQLARIGMESITKKAASRIPAVRTGRYPSLSPMDREKMVDHILELIGKGASTKVAKFRASLKFPCSKRTVDRIWMERGKAADERPTMKAVVEAIRSSGQALGS